MRHLVTVLIAVFVGCAAPKRTAAPEASGPTFLLGAEAPYVALDAPGWHRTPGEGTDLLLLHWHDHKGDRGVAVWIKDADPGSTVEAAMTRFAAMLLAMPVLFSGVEASPVETRSDEEALFSFRGVDSKTKTRMLALCRVKLVSGHGTAYWAMILTYGSETLGPKMTFEADALARTLRILKPTTP